ncbi:MAG: sulfatase-like hydrolase/transferase [Promethearchaeota archaeon]
MKKPNIIFILSDQQRWDTLGCYGQKLNVTPNLNKMAEEGVLFENTFSCQPVCGPTRACLQTGKYPTEIGCFRNHRMLPFNEKTIAHHLSENGYEVGYIGKWHLASQGPLNGPDNFRAKPVPLERRGGYKDFWLASDVLEHTSHSYDGHMFDGDMNKRKFPEGRYRVDAITDWVLEYLDYLDNLQASNGKKPFFLYLSYLEPHHQNDHNQYEGPKGSKEKFKNFEIPGDLEFRKEDRNEDRKGDWNENFPDYLGCCNSLDENVGRITEKLEELNLTGNTVVFYVSDHGSHFKTRNAEYKRSCHESSIHVPLIIKGPSFSGGIRVNDLVSLIDLPPTILDVADVKVPGYMKGKSVKNLIDGTPTDWRKDVFIQISESQVGRALRTKKWKYSVKAPDKNPWKHSASEIYIEEFLYDLENDIYERNNLVKDPAFKKIRAELSATLKERMAEASEGIPEIIQ